MKALQRLRLVPVVATVALAVSGPGPARAADEFPNRPLRIVVPFAPGGGTTAMARAVGDPLGARLGQPVVIENRDGAGGTTGTALAAKSRPDGYTLMLAHSGTIAIAPHLYRNIAYDALKDFTPIGLIAQIPLLLVVSANVPAKNVNELIKYAQANPGKLSYASGGVGTGGHLAAALWAATVKIDIKHIPYRGSGPTLPDLLAGRVDLSLGPAVPFIQHLATGRLRGLAITTAERSPLVPDVPSMKEAGVPNYEVALYYGIIAPAGVPEAIVERLSRELRGIVALPETRAVVEREGGAPMPVTAAQYRDIMVADYRKWGDAVKISGAKLTE